jgi:CheY-like chemotaxis protein
VAWRVEGGLADTARLVALGVRVVTGDEEALRLACEEALEVRDGRTMRVDPPTEIQSVQSDVLDLHGRPVIVADDDPAIRWFLADLLRAEGCDVHDVSDGDVALDVARRTAPDLILTDIRMPRMNGVALCRALRSDPILGDVPVGLLSWKSDWLQDARDLGIGASFYLEKRSTPEDVLLAVREAVLPLARLDQRFREPAPVRGRLGVVAPYRVLRLACALRKNADVAFQCNAYGYEVHIRDGAPCSATRTSENGHPLRGPAALAALLPERDGQFALSSGSGPVEANLAGSVHQQLGPLVAQFRRPNTNEGPAGSKRADPHTNEGPRLAVPQAPPPAAHAAQDAADIVKAVPAAPPRPNHAPVPSREALARAAAMAPPPGTGSPQRPADRTRPLQSAPPSAPRRARETLRRMRDRLRHGMSAASRPRLPIHWVGLAAVATLGVVLGAGIRVWRQHTDAGAAPSAAALRP